ncbi:MAG: glycerophosphodiester phosphodiesterase [Oscillospiraceae bacterium]|nr:glycerophosphodiester phosphodiesterase [Oscillospiraceae bacterium]
MKGASFVTVSTNPPLLVAARPLLTAHAGCEHTQPDTLPSLQTALALPCEAIEVDVCQAADGTLYLSHSPGAAPSGCCPLAAAFKLIRALPARQINCDLKQAGLEAAVLKTAASCQVLERVTLSGSVRTAFVKDWQAVVRIYLNIEGLLPQLNLADLQARLRVPTGADTVMPRPVLTAKELDYMFDQALRFQARVLNLPYQLCDERLLQLAAQTGIRLSVWTVDALPLQRTFLRLAAQVTSQGCCRLHGRPPPARSLPRRRQP